MLYYLYVSTSHKIAVSFLISILIFGALSALAYTGLFDLLETRFYNPTITASITRENARNAEATENFFTEMQERFSELLSEDAVRRALMSNAGIEDILARERTFRFLIESLDGVQWVRFIESGGIRVLFSTYASDIQRQDGIFNTYRNFNEPFLPYEMIAVPADGTPKLTFDERGSRILFSFPLFDYFNDYRGTALFSLSVNVLSNRLMSEGKLQFGHNITVISNPEGLLFGITSAGESAQPAQISSLWRSEGERTVRLFSSITRHYLVLFSIMTSHGFFVGRLVNESIFSLSPAMEAILLASVFMTLFLIIFLIFNFRQDPVAVVQNRLKQLQASLVEQFCEMKSEADLTRWMRDIDLRRNEIIVQLEQGINFNSDKEKDEIDTLINNSWDELLVILGGRKVESVDEEKLHALMKRILSDIKIAHYSPPHDLRPNSASLVRSSPPPLAVTGKTNSGKPGLLMKATAIVKAIEETDEVEELEELAPAEDIAAPPKAKLSEEDVKMLESKIEFSPSSGDESLEDDSTDESIKDDLEIVSPLDGMVFDFSAGDKGEDIEELDGVPYISGETISTDAEKETPLNPELKELVDSVIK